MSVIQESQVIDNGWTLLKMAGALYYVRLNHTWVGAGLDLHCSSDFPTTPGSYDMPASLPGFLHGSVKPYHDIHAESVRRVVYPATRRAYDTGDRIGVLSTFQPFAAHGAEHVAQAR